MLFQLISRAKLVCSGGANKKVSNRWTNLSKGWTLLFFSGIIAVLLQRKRHIKCFFEDKIITVSANLG